MDQDIVVCEPLRTPIGAFGGQFRDIPAHELSATVVRELMSRTGLDPELVADVIMGQGYATSEAPCIGRVTALDAGLPVTVPGKQVDRRCGSGLQAVVDAAMVVGSGNGDFVIAGGVESMSHAPFYNDTIRWGVRGGNADFIDSLDADGPLRAESSTPSRAECSRPRRICAGSTRSAVRNRTNWPSTPISGRPRRQPMDGSPRRSCP